MVDDHTLTESTKRWREQHGMFTSFTQKACLRTNTGRLPKGNAQQRTTTMKSKMSDQRMIDYTDMLDGLTWEIETAITNCELEVKKIYTMKRTTLLLEQ